MAGHKKIVAFVLVITCMLTCSALRLQPSIFSSTAMRYKQEEGRVHFPVQPNDVLGIKGPLKRVDLETDTDRVSDRLGSTDKLVFARLPRGPVPPSGPSTGPPCYNPEECHD